MKVHTHAIRIKKVDWLLILSVVAAPMTGLRVWKIGPAELLAIIWSLLNYKVYLKMPKKSPMVKFWPWFLSFSLIGTVICQVSYPEESRLIDMFTWLYLALISYAAYVEMNKRSTWYLVELMRKTTIVSAAVYLLLFVYAQSTRSFLGARLWYGSRFTGGADNPHQLALLMGIVAVWGLWMYMTARSIKDRLIAVAVAAVGILLLLQTQSSTALMATVAGYAIVLFETFARKKKSPWKIRISGIVIAGVVLVVFLDQLWSLFYGWVASDSNGLGRFAIFASYPETFWKSPVFGLGPGVHGLDGTIEFHNTYLEVLAMSGIAGGITFVIFTINILKETRWSPYALGMVVTLYVFGLAGFGMRRLVFWIVLSIVCIYAKRLKRVESVERQ